MLRRRREARHLPENLSEPAAPGRPLQGKVVLVTGAARGIGRELATAMAQAGADVALTARSAQAARVVALEIQSHGARAAGFQLDLRDRETVPSLVDEVEAALGSIDVLVCNSGVAGPSDPVWMVQDAEWDEVLAVNVTGPFACVRAVAPHMVKAHGGAILFIGSMTGKRPLLHRSVYAASKMAVLGLCRTLALDLGPFGVRVNLISPGFVEGDRLNWVIESQAEAQQKSAVLVREEMRRQSPLHRFTKASDVASTAVFLASDAAAGVTGEDVNVSSGLVMF